MSTTLRNGSCSEDPGKRQAILEQAIRTFAELGFRGADVQMIADRAGVGKGTVYRYFRSKEDLFWAASYEVLLRLDKHVFAALSECEGACRKLRGAAAAYTRFFEDNPHYLELAVQERAEFRGTGPESHREHHQKMVAKMGDVIRRGIETGELRPVDGQQTTLALACLLYGTTVLGRHLELMGVPQMAEYAVDMFLQGIRRKPADDSASTELIGSKTP